MDHNYVYVDTLGYNLGVIFREPTVDAFTPTPSESL